MPKEFARSQFTVIVDAIARTDSHRCRRPAVVSPSVSARSLDSKFLSTFYPRCIMPDAIARTDSHRCRRPAVVSPSPARAEFSSEHSEFLDSNFLSTFYPRYIMPKELNSFGKVTLVI